MEEKKPRLLRWPWNVVVYILLAAALRIFAVPVILLLVWVQRKNNPHGGAEGYCLSRTRKRLVWLLWSLLMLFIGFALASVFLFGLSQDRASWDVMDYVTLAVSGGGGTLMLVLGLYMGFCALRDAFFPARSALAQSIRNQLPYPEEAPPVGELFAMVDNDLKENAQWFDAVGIGREWVLGDLATRIDRIRGIFVVDEIHRHHTQTGTRTNRTLQLVLIDDRWQRSATNFGNPRELQAAADCLALRVPEAVRGTNDQYLSFWKMDESGREAFEQDFRQKRSLRASEQARREADGPQDMILRRAGGEVTSRVTLSMAEECLRACLDGGGSFSLTPTRPVPAGEQQFQALHVSADETGLWVTLVPASSPELGVTRGMSPQAAREILAAWLRREAPDTSSWETRRAYDPTAQGPRVQPRRQSHAKLTLLYASGAAESHDTFTQEDVQMAADGIVDGTYQMVDLVHPAGYLWIRVTAGDKMDARCTVSATKPGGEELEFYTAKMTPREAAAWLTGYPYNQYLPGGGNWKRDKKKS